VYVTNSVKYADVIHTVNMVAAVSGREFLLMSVKLTYYPHSQTRKISAVFCELTRGSFCQVTVVSSLAEATWREATPAEIKAVHGYYQAQPSAAKLPVINFTTMSMPDPKEDTSESCARQASTSPPRMKLRKRAHKVPETAPVPNEEPAEPKRAKRSKSIARSSRSRSVSRTSAASPPAPLPSTSQDDLRAFLPKLLQLLGQVVRQPQSPAAHVPVAQGPHVSTAPPMGGTAPNINFYFGPHCHDASHA
jgi:hypothetical protein